MGTGLVVPDLQAENVWDLKFTGVSDTHALFRPPSRATELPRMLQSCTATLEEFTQQQARHSAHRRVLTGPARCPTRASKPTSMLLPTAIKAEVASPGGDLHTPLLDRPETLRWPGQLAQQGLEAGQYPAASSCAASEAPQGQLSGSPSDSPGSVDRSSQARQ